SESTDCAVTAASFTERALTDLPSDVAQSTPSDVAQSIDGKTTRPHRVWADQKVRHPLAALLLILDMPSSPRCRGSAERPRSQSGMCRMGGIDSWTQWAWRASLRKYSNHRGR